MSSHATDLAVYAKSSSSSSSQLPANVVRGKRKHLKRFRVGSFSALDFKIRDVATLKVKVDLVAEYSLFFLFYVKPMTISKQLCSDVDFFMRQYLAYHTQVLNFFFNFHSLRISIINISILAFCQVLLNEYDDDDDDDLSVIATSQTLLKLLLLQLMMMIIIVIITRAGFR